MARADGSTKVRCSRIGGAGTEARRGEREKRRRLRRRRKRRLRRRRRRG